MRFPGNLAFQKAVFFLMGGCLLLSSFCLAEEAPRKLFTVQVEKTWTLDEARVEAFRNAPTRIDLSAFSKMDPDFSENFSARTQGGGLIGSRMVTVFEQGRYSVTNRQEVSRSSFSVPYYTVSGMLYAVDINHRAYPRKTYKYAAQPNPERQIEAGQLVRIAIEVAPMNSYSFNVDGSLDVHWEGNRCTRMNGDSCGTRQVLADTLPEPLH